jgi:multiple sugar transport system substrate-binding protein
LRLTALGMHALVPVLALVAGGCTSGSPGAREPQVVLRVLLPASERPDWSPIARGFEAAHPGARVDLVEGPESTDLREDLYTASLLARDPSFDLVYMDVTWTAKFAAAGWLRRLDGEWTPDELSAFLPADLAAGRWNGGLYRLPVRTDVGGLYYRADLLAAAGLSPPVTFDDLVADAKRLQSPPRLWGFVWQGRQYEGLVCAFLEVLAGCGGTWVDPVTGEVGLDRPEAARALQFLVDCVRSDRVSPPGVTTYQEEECRRLFQDGRAAFQRNWPYVWALAQRDDSPVRGRVGVAPMVHEPGRTGAAALGGWGLGISAYSRHPALAAAFAREVVSLEGQRRLCEATGFAPARAEAYRDSALLAANPFLARLSILSAHAVARPAIARYAEASDVLQRHLSAALAGSEPVADALARAAAETQRLLGPRPEGR